MIEAGMYTARATEAAYGQTSKGTDQVAVDFQITSSQNPQYEGAHITWYGYLSAAAAERTLEAIIACGCTNLDTLEGITTNEVQLVIQHEPDLESRLRARVAFVNKLGGIAMKSRMNEGESRAVAAKWKGKFEALRKGQPTSSPNSSAPRRQMQASGFKGSPHDPPGVQPGTHPADDDIPF